MTRPSRCRLGPALRRVGVSRGTRASVSEATADRRVGGATRSRRATVAAEARASGRGFDPLDALQSTRQQRAACRAVAAVFDEVVPPERELALARVQRDLALAFGDDG